MNKSEIIDMLAAGMTVRVPAKDLINMVDKFWDSENYDGTMTPTHDLLEEKYAELNPDFVASVTEHGVYSPCEVRVFDDSLEFLDGHHRMALALALDIDLPLSIIDHEDFGTNRYVGARDWV